MVLLEECRTETLLTGSSSMKNQGSESDRIGGMDWVVLEFLIGQSVQSAGFLFAG